MQANEDGTEKHSEVIDLIDRANGAIHPVDAEPVVSDVAIVDGAVRVTYPCPGRVEQYSVSRFREAIATGELVLVEYDQETNALEPVDHPIPNTENA